MKEEDGVIKKVITWTLKKVSKKDTESVSNSCLNDLRCGMGILKWITRKEMQFFYLL